MLNLSNCVPETWRINNKVQWNRSGGTWQAKTLCWFFLQFVTYPHIQFHLKWIGLKNTILGLTLFPEPPSSGNKHEVNFQWCFISCFCSKPAMMKWSFDLSLVSAYMELAFKGTAFQYTFSSPKSVQWLLLVSDFELHQMKTWTHSDSSIFKQMIKALDTR